MGRFGAMEAPPAIMSTYLGEDLTSYLEAFVNGETAAYAPSKKDLSIGVKDIPAVKVPAEDRNRSSPFPYGGARFEFRAAGSAQNVSMINTVLNTICAEKNVDLFEKMGVMSPEETASRETVLHEHYTGTVEVETGTFVDMIQQHIIPSVKAAGTGPLAELEAGVASLTAALGEIHAAETTYEKAQLARVLRLETMADVRKACDEAEETVPADLWTLATYKELLFLDSH